MKTATTNKIKNFDFYIYYVGDVSLHFAYDGEMQIHGKDRLNFKDFEMAVQGYKAMKKFIDFVPGEAK
jgi:hypothetical protein